ncbi:MAG TPA: hypothetical protein VI756_17720 [Blastocatellia bacterium]
MSFDVLVIPEDFTKDEHILKPLVEQILSECGRKATVRVCRNPNFQGVHAALNINALRAKVVARYPMVDLFVLLVDRDGNEGRKERVARIESTLSAELPGCHNFVAEVAWQEAEVFILAGQRLPRDWKWTEIRADADVKNTFFKQLVALRGLGTEPYEGRKKLMAESISNWQRIKSICPEDVGADRSNIRVALSPSGTR